MGRFVKVQVKADPLDLPGFTTVRARLSIMARPIFCRTLPGLLLDLILIRSLRTPNLATAFFWE